MLIPALIAAVGLLLIYSEFFLPGGVMGASGALLTLISLGMYASQGASLIELTLFFFVLLFALGGVIKLALKRIQQGEGERSIYLKGDQEGYVASQFEESAIGKEGEAASDLKPSGHIFVEGRRYQALSQSSYVKQGTPVLVLSGRGAYLIVKPKK